MMKKFLFIYLMMFPSLFAANEVGCVCKDATVQSPDCGICGSRDGYMLPTQTGAACYCENKLKSKDVSCIQACEKHGGWTGDKEYQG